MTFGSTFKAFVDENAVLPFLLIGSKIFLELLRGLQVKSGKAEFFFAWYCSIDASCESD